MVAEDIWVAEMRLVEKLLEKADWAPVEVPTELLKHELDFQQRRLLFCETTSDTVAMAQLDILAARVDMSPGEVAAIESVVAWIREGLEPTPSANPND